MAKKPDDFHYWLSQLTESNIHYFLEGGQAVNIWALTFLERCNALQDYLPFTSKDCDIWISSDGLKQIGSVLKGSLKKSHSPSDGQLGIITSEDKKLTLDLLSNVFGLNMQELKRAQKRVLEVENVKIIDPIYLFKGKCHNLVNLPQVDRNDAKHLKILILVIPLYLEGFLEAITYGDATQRDLIREIKLFLNFRKDLYVRQAMRLLEVTFEEMIPMNRLINSRFDLIKKYTVETLNKNL